MNLVGCREDNNPVKVRGRPVAYIAAPGRAWRVWRRFEQAAREVHVPLPTRERLLAGCGL